MTRSSVRHSRTIAVAVAWFGWIASAAAQPAKVSACAMTGDRMRALVAVLVALFGVVNGVLALRSTVDDAPSSARRATVALLSGLSGTALAGLVVTTAQGGLGTGHGRGGGVVALVLGILAVGLATRARLGSRSRSSN